MAETFESGALLGHAYTLAGGLAVRLRLARSSDAPAIMRLLQSHGLAHSELEPARLVHFDPRRRYVLCATGLVNSTETLHGVGAIDLDGSAEPELLLVAHAQPPEVAGLLRRALVASAHARARAA
jgi:hypothetical protein